MPGLRPILPIPIGDDWTGFAGQIVAMLRGSDIWGYAVQQIDAQLSPGTQTLILEQVAPEGWKDVGGGLGDRLYRTAATGGGTGGDWLFTGMSFGAHTLTIAEMPAHAHGVEVIATANHAHHVGLDSNTHTHPTFTTATQAAHVHTLASQSNPGDHTHGWAGAGSAFSGPKYNSSSPQAGTFNWSTAGAHHHSLSTETQAAHAHLVQTLVTDNHSHSISLVAAGDHLHDFLTTETGGGQAHGHSFTTNASWRPAYVDALLCERLEEGAIPPAVLAPIVSDTWGKWARAFASQGTMALENLGHWLDSRINRLAPSRNHMVFMQSAAPLGWVQDQAWNDRVLRVAPAAGGTTGGSWALSGIAADLHFLTEDEIPAHSHSVTLVAAGAHNHVLASDLAGSHVHSFTTDATGAHEHTGLSSDDGAHTHAQAYGSGALPPGLWNFILTTDGLMTTYATDLGGTHTHSLSFAPWVHAHAYLLAAVADHTHNASIDDDTHGHSVSVQAVGGGLGHSHSLSATGLWRPAYIDCIVCVRP